MIGLDLTVEPRLLIEFHDLTRGARRKTGGFQCGNDVGLYRAAV